MVEAPSQNSEVPEMVTSNAGITKTGVAFVSVQPFGDVPMTENVLFETGETNLTGCVFPSFQR
ncbi:hypothetical protein D3C80_967680 [compost metagenome]